MAKYSIYNTLSYCESTATRRPQLSVLDSFRSVPQFWQQFLHCAGVTVEVPVGMQACAVFFFVGARGIYPCVCVFSKKSPRCNQTDSCHPVGRAIRFRMQRSTWSIFYCYWERLTQVWVFLTFLDLLSWQKNCWTSTQIDKSVSDFLPSLLRLLIFARKGVIMLFSVLLAGKLDFYQHWGCFCCF